MEGGYPSHLELGMMAGIGGRLHVWPLGRLFLFCTVKSTIKETPSFITPGPLLIGAGQLKNGEGSEAVDG